jgi:peptidoglycan pentaglycine glycine transferase (the first glycine)
MAAIRRIMHRDYRQSKGFQELSRSGGATVVDLGGGDVGYVLSPKFLPWLRILIAPYVHDPESLAAADEWSRRCRAVFVNLVPQVVAGSEGAERWQRALDGHRYSVARLGSAPTKTLMLELDPDADELLRGMKEKTRYNIRLAERRGVTAEVLDGRAVLGDGGRFDEFYSVYEQNCRRVGTKSQPHQTLRQFVGGLQEDVFAVFARSGGETAAVALCVLNDGTAVYEMNGSTEGGRKAFAPTLVMWKAILEAKRRGCRRFDFGGTFDGRYQKAQEVWKGFSQFKAGFGGLEVTYLGSFVKWLPFLRRRRRRARAPAGASCSSP